ncbi:hypothetical protein V2J09_022795 [Rumex salicifolius]
MFDVFLHELLVDQRGKLRVPMITCIRTVLRTDRTLQRVDTINSSTRLRSFQFPEGYSYHSLTRLCNQTLTENYSSSMDWNKKRKSVNPEWRPVSTLSSLNAAASSVLPDNTKGNAAEGAHLPAAKHSISIEVGASLMRFIKGKGGGMQKSIEEDMGVKITFTPHKNADSIVVEGDSAKSVANASDKIQAVISETVQSPNFDYSHFISLPLGLHPELVEKLLRFQNSILGNNSREEDMKENADVGSDEDASEDKTKNLQLKRASSVKVKLNVEDDGNHVTVDFKNIPLISDQLKSLKTKTLSDLGIDKSVFIKPKTFHVTILMLKLWNRERVDAAKDVLHSISPKVMDALQGRPLSVRLKGLDCMQGSLSKARVLYAPVEEVGNRDRLLRASRILLLLASFSFSYVKLKQDLSLKEMQGAS